MKTQSAKHVCFSVIALGFSHDNKDLKLVYMLENTEKRLQESDIFELPDREKQQREKMEAGEGIDEWLIN